VGVGGGEMFESTCHSSVKISVLRIIMIDEMYADEEMTFSTTLGNLGVLEKKIKITPQQGATDFYPADMANWLPNQACALSMDGNVYTRSNKECIKIKTATAG
jgi:hypothetical protein